MTLFAKSFVIGAGLFVGGVAGVVGTVLGLYCAADWLERRSLKEAGQCRPS